MRTPAGPSIAPPPNDGSKSGDATLIAAPPRMHGAIAEVIDAMRRGVELREREREGGFAKIRAWSIRFFRKSRRTRVNNRISS
jgi:hypothetical protein